MAEKIFLLSNVAHFAPGFFENTVAEGDYIQLQKEDGAYPQVGSYTSPSFPAEDFFSLVPSWNADAPPGTGVEMQVRVAADGQWSRWFSFGVWSPYIHSASPPPQEDDIARCRRDTLDLVEGCPAAEVLQMRIFLYSEEPAATPRVWLLGVSTNAAHQVSREQKAYDRLLEAPAYACLNRDPAISRQIASVTALTMLLNRHGRDLLPEEVARMARDAGAADRPYQNLSFLAAVGGACGYRCHVAYAGLSTLRRRVWDGNVVAARVHYRAQALPGIDESEDLAARPEAPLLEEAITASSGHLVVVRGFIRKNEREYVVMNDPLAPGNDAVSAEVPLSVFAKIYTGMALFLDRPPKGAGAACPRRAVAELSVRDGCLFLDLEGRNLVPGGLEGDILPATLCYTLSDGVAYASAAQRHFYYVGPTDGPVPIDAATQGRKLTFYLAGSCGEWYVAEKWIEKTPGARPGDGDGSGDEVVPQTKS